MTTSDLIKTWIKEMRLGSHYTINSYDMIECKKYHSSGINRVRIFGDSIYYWQISNGEFNKIEISVADPDFFEKLLVLLQNQCNGRQKVYRQL